MLSGSSERKSSIFPSVASFTHWLIFARSSSCLPVSFTGFAPKSLSDCSRKSSLMGNPACSESQIHSRASTSTSVLPEAQPLPSPLCTRRRTLPGQLAAISTYLSAGIFWQLVGLSQGIGSGRNDSVDAGGRIPCSRATLVASSLAFGSEHLKGIKQADTQAMGSFWPHCPLPHSHIPIKNMATDHYSAPSQMHGAIGLPDSTFISTANKPGNVTPLKVPFLSKQQCPTVRHSCPLEDTVAIKFLC